MRRFLLLSSLFVLLSGLFSVLLPTQKVNATSMYDNTIAQGQATLICNNGVDVYDLSKTFAGIVYDAGNSSFNNALDTAYNAGKGWGLSQNVNLTTTDNNTLLFWVMNDPNSSATFKSYGLYPDGYLSISGYVATISCPTNGVFGTYFSSFSSDREVAFSTHSSGTVSRRLVFANSNIAYPTGYEGLEPSATLTEPTIVRPDLQYTYSGKKITITAKDIGSQPYLNTDDKIALYISTGNFDTGDPPFQDWTYLVGQSNGVWNFTAPDYGSYSLQAYYTDSTGTPLSDTDDYDYRYTTYSITLSASASGQGDTSSLECTPNDYGQVDCVTPAPETTQDCSPYSDVTKLPELAGCLLGNLWINAKNFFGFDGSSATYVGQITNFDTNTHGLTGVITAPVAFLKDLANVNYSCTPIDLPLPYLTNKNLTLPCMTTYYQNMFGQAFVLYQSIATAIVSYYVLVNLLAMIKGFKEPKNNKIEVIEL